MTRGRRRIIASALLMQNHPGPSSPAKLTTFKTMLEFLLTRMIPCLLLMIPMAFPSVLVSETFAQNKTLKYQISQKGDPVGHMVFTQHSSPSQTALRIVSEINTRFVMTIVVHAVEEATYENDILQSSFVYRTQNGRETLNKTTTPHLTGYQITDGDDTEFIDAFPINYNMICLYAYEPVGISKVYSDIFEQFIDIQKLGPNHYKVRFPNGSYNEYHYLNGICMRVEVNHNLYDATITLSK